MTVCITWIGNPEKPQSLWKARLCYPPRNRGVPLRPPEKVRAGGGYTRNHGLRSPGTHLAVPGWRKAVDAGSWKSSTVAPQVRFLELGTMRTEGGLCSSLAALPQKQH